MASRRSHLTLIFLVVAALVGVGLLGVPSSPFHRSLKQGLDLQGGLEVVLQAEPKKGETITSAEMDNAISIMRTRVDKLGVSEPVITKQGTNQIVIELPAVHDATQAAKIIGQTAQLELYDLTPSLLGPSIDASENPVPNTNLFDLLGLVQAGQKGTPSGYYLFSSRAKKLIAGPDQTLAALKHDPVVLKLSPVKPKTVTVKTKAKKATKGHKAVKASTTRKVLPPGKTSPGFPTGYQVLTVPATAVVISCDATVAAVCPGLSVAPAPGVTYYYLFKHGTIPGDSENPYPQMTGKDLKLSGTQADVDPNGGGPIVTMQFTGQGNKLFHQITREEAQRGQALGNDDFQSFAIVLDDQIYSFPTIDYTKFADGIDPTGTGAEITGLQSQSEANHLALVLQTGALPVRFKTVERSDVSATLGKDSLRQARNAAIAGLIIVALFLLLLYRFLGVVAVVGLAIYSALMYGAILLLGVTLTLPGFAGLILTIGVAADANVVIFERIKEEARAGRSVRASIAAGYAKGFRTIVDANVVTAIAALILFAVATAEVKGFALMLLIGTVVSLITAVAATRALLGLLAGFRWFQDPRFMGAKAEDIPAWQRIDVVTRRRLYFILSIVAVALSVAAIAFQGLNLGIDFKGGVQVTFTTPKAVTLTSVRSETKVATGRSDAVVQGRGKLVGSESYSSFQIRLKKLKSGQQDTLTNDLIKSFDANQPSVKNVSASFSKQILNGAILAIIVSFALIAVYVTIRYRWRFAIPILRTLGNDIPIVMGVYAISGREVSADTVAAILTILGYSVYDTIIVFDRVRENMRLMPKSSIPTIVNVSVSEVLKRSIVTSTITLLPIVALFIFGGSTLRDFAFAIMVGIAVGAVSTIFIATPILSTLLERDPEYAGRRGEAFDAKVRAKVLRAAERAAADEPTPTVIGELEEAMSELGHPLSGEGTESEEAKRARRRQRRQSRPHGRPR
ncbi:MAG TPA: protein translocase subunit SecD [Gaiellaceae bacterium]|nr:protein translocase subunit SecD [Gaiellaceae bacterium]